MKKAFMLVLLAMLFCTQSALAETELVGISLGGVNIQLPAPNGFSEVSDVSPQIRNRAERLTPPQNRLLAFFVPDAALQRFKKGEVATLVYDRYMVVQAFRGMESGNVSSQQFRELVRHIRQEQGHLSERDRERAQSYIDDVSKELSKERGISIDLKVGQPLSLGVFAEGDNFIAYAGLTKYKIAAEGKALEMVNASAISFIRVKKKLIFGYVYAKHDSEKDIDWVRAAAKDWIQKILSANGSGS
ncbi:MAG: hypothetical protein PVG99_09370 [Desulfobacteraceae bacterium]|jgi:hypothetical protein